MQRAFPGTKQEGWRAAAGGRGGVRPDRGQAGGIIDFRPCHFSGSERKGQDKPEFHPCPFHTPGCRKGAGDVGRGSRLALGEGSTCGEA